jgi:hypothetical protein
VKFKKLFRILVVALTLVLLFVAIPAVPVSAAAVIDVDLEEGEIGDEITLTGSGFPVSSELYVFFARQQADVGDEIDEEVTVYSFIGSVVTFFDGRILGLPFNIPAKLDDGLVLAEDEDVFGGNYYIYVTYENSETIRAVTSIRVISNAAITGFNPDEGNVGTEVEISGQGFVPGEVIIIEYDGDELEIDSGDEVADNNGEFTLYIIIPDSEYGDHTVTIKGEDSLAELAETFSVKPEIRANLANGEVGTEITITGTGFDRRNGVDFSFGSTQITNILWLLEALGRTNPDGTFIVQITVPDVATGSYIILAEDEDDGNIFATTTFEVVVNTAVNVSPTTGFVGDSITIVGSSFGAGATATINFDNEEIDTVLIGIDGSFTANVNIPESATGVHTILIEDTAGRSAMATVNVEPEMEMSPLDGIMGDEVNISGTGFGASKDITIKYGDTTITQTTQITTDTSGSFNGSFDVPVIAGGSYTVTVSDDVSDLTSNFTVGSGITINPTSGEMGDGVQLTGYGFQANRTITILYGNVVIIPTAPITSDTVGNFTGSFNVPAIPGGSTTITISDGTTDINASFTVRANIQLSPTTGKMGDGLGIAGYGFAANRSITVLFNNSPVTLLAPITTDVNGIFSGAQFYVPASPGGSAVIIISDGTTTIPMSFTVETGDISISPKTSNASPGHIGTELTISGDGYAADAPIEVTYDSVALTTEPEKTGSNGSFVATFEIPQSTTGEHTITVNVNGDEIEQFTFIMESVAPPAPELVTIFLSEKVEPPIRFDWREVDDDSLPVTYNLEIYTIKGSNEITIIEHLGLNVTEYTLTETEVLTLVPLENNEYYYWRVNAEDGAGNVSSWIAIDTFYIDGEGWPGWLMWLWIGLGGLAVFILALWLGRRIAYSSY